MNEAQILLIDDDTHMLEILQTIIKGKTSYRCATVTSGDAGIKFAQDMQPDLIILDINMPEMDGFQLCRQLKQEKTTREIPVIFLTGRSDTKSKVRAFESGAADYISKPFDADEVIARIKAHIELKRTQEENVKYLKALYQTRYLGGLATMVQGFAHNFNNLMTIVSGQVQLLQKVTQQNRESEAIAQKIHQTIQRITDLIQRLQVFSAAKEHSYQPLKVNTVLDKIIQSFEVGLPEQIKIHKDFQEDLPDINVNLDLFWQVVINLLTNAYESLPGTGEIFVASRIETYTTPLAVRPQSYICLEIRDTGKGIKKEDIERVYEPFFTSKCNVGVGLGLSMAYALMKRWNGSIQMQSQPGKGTTVKLCFHSYDKTAAPKQ